ncbi:MAG: hypothetical protein V3576_04975 [Candidatus Cloacimonadota bacterium]
MKFRSFPLCGAVLAILVLISLTACETNRFRQVEDLYKKERYAATIQEIDAFLRVAENGALATRAEMLRAESYMQLGLMAVERQNLDLAIRFFKISNSPESDVHLAEIYKRLALEALETGNNELTMEYLNTIQREIPDSRLIPEVLFRKISLYQTVYLDNDSAWRDYRRLYDDYSDNSYEIQARNYASRLIPGFIAHAQQLSDTGYYTEALGLLFEMDRYPVVDHPEMQRLISDVYQAQAEGFLVSEDYLEADRLLRIALQYDPSKKAEIDARLASITGLFIQMGDRYLAQRDFPNAMLYYNKTFEIIPDYAEARAAIARLEQIQINIARAQVFATEAEEMEAGRRHAEALRLYQQAANLENKPEYRQKIATMQNLIEADRNPEAFAQRIINEYRGGVLNRKIRQQVANLRTRFRENEIRDSGWKILLSTGQYKYEARYDLLTPTDTFFYIWQVNLRDRSLVPLNRISEELMQ